ncbi:MAG: VCBS repeat-containing protein [Roseibacillus sp.]|nr:VCBS repeat-containing protein [Roseibacillus sp.]
MFSSAGNRITFQDQFKPGGDPTTRALYQRHARGNSLFRNLGSGRFEDVSISSGTTMGRWAWSSLFVDLDNNGWEDLLVANGFITQEDPGDL